MDENNRGTSWVAHATNVAMLDEVNEIRTKTKRKIKLIGYALTVIVKMKINGQRTRVMIV